MSPQQRAKVRVCASCEWIFRNGADCPMCGFGSYGARFVFGDDAYRYEKKQTPWIEKKMKRYRAELEAIAFDND